jgi:hypothetical protein
VEKLVYCLWRPPHEDIGAIRSSLLHEVAPRLLDSGVSGLRIEVEEPAASVMQVGALPDGSRLCASASVWLDSYDDRAPIEDALALPGATFHGWIVAESVPKAYGVHRTWPDGQQSPGLSILTIFDKGPHVDEASFYRIWHGEHTPLTFEIHPFWLYVRNQVLRPVTEGAPSARGIVYEAVATDRELLDLPTFFGCPDEPERLMEQIGVVDAHLATFADTATLQCVATREWIFRTFPARTGG